MLKIYHYYESDKEPFLNLSHLKRDRAIEVLEELRVLNPAYEVLDVSLLPWFLTRRAELEKIARDLFISKGGKPKSNVPHYMTLGECDYLKGWFLSPSCIEISFCYGDLFQFY